jgi:hypothetical protein
MSTTEPRDRVDSGWCTAHPGSGDALRSPELRLFREYAKRNDPALNFEDRSLVDLLATPTRTHDRPVPVGFWQGNEEVMTAVVDTVRALRRALTVVAT